MKQSPIHKAAMKLCRKLDELSIPFAIAGALATTSLEFESTKGMRDTEHRVKIDILLSGDFPGDGKPKPVVFPLPENVSTRDSDGV